MNIAMTHIKMGRFHILEMKRSCGFEHSGKTAQGLNDLYPCAVCSVTHKNEDILQARRIFGCYNGADKGGTPHEKRSTNGSLRR